ncbi:otubain cysteine peptidase, Clan CA, family C65,putative [Trypanosoma brucei gambiense DAL972]|uniref:Ubiquitin thioesterase n=1 Tax=Trypanosoma brucei gambiense (strain MHOM/CI/86/DAL972) TaxID=679716 RepID=C9ZPB3_TRYB9|nr:otubain cysteine peptidase, Clan CA, family C65,putative [Trypanosoma brucei gambiense DAL972]CBH11241.1 otubain cysteine peptidase, Clan CA, family C65,putative [Trypanosoma brucei gambiense DAL972]|eukprot:XP_011773528.1 otubain cysteine peptidase, Clan CA, family C65,putative [Trypanosoma brucei gambiense DAL972]
MSEHATTDLEGRYAQLATIQSEIDAAPLLSPTVEKLGDGCNLMIEFSDNPPMLVKVVSLWRNEETKYKGIRYARRDGNCFYRSVVFGMHESLLNNKERAGAHLERITDLSRQVVADYGNFAEDFCHPAVEMAKKIESGECSTVEQLYELSTNGEAEYALYFYRYAVSHHIRTHENDFLPFVVGMGHETVSEFCSAEVDAVASEADNVQVVAFAQCFDVRVIVEYVDGREGDCTTRHTFQQKDSHDANEYTTIEVTLLYRPGHYDLLYK